MSCAQHVRRDGGIYLFDFQDTGKLTNSTETLPEFGTELTEEEISLMDEQSWMRFLKAFADRMRQTSV